MEVSKKSPPPIHHSDWHHRVEGELRVANKNVFELASIAGATPFYVYDRAAVTHRVQALRQALPEQVQLHYAIKANPMPAVVNHLARLVDGLDVASHKELLSALSSGIAPQEISFAGPGKSPVEFEAAAAAGITLIAESMAQIESVAEVGNRLKVTPRIALRVNPAFELKSSGMRMTGGAKPFGIDDEQIPAAVRLCRSLGLEPEGLHLFTGSQNLNADAICEAHSRVIDLALELVEQLNLKLRFINIGGGLGIPYFPGEHPLRLSPIAENLTGLLKKMSERCPDTHLVMEMGRYLVGEAGLYVCRILEKKVSRGTTYLVTDGGLHHHLSNSGNFGQVIRKNYPVEIACTNPSETKEQVTIVGPLCTPLDIVAEKVILPAAEVGDLVIIRQSGAYGLSASPLGFLSHPQPQEILL